MSIFNLFRNKGASQSSVEMPIQDKPINPVLQHLIEKTEEENREWKQRHLKYLEEHDPALYFENHILPCLIPATPDHYILWLKGFIENGGKPTHYYDYDIPYNFYVAIGDFKIPNKKYAGSNSFHVIVPTGMTVTHTGFDHCGLFLMDNYKPDPDYWIPVFKNTVF